MYTRLCFASEWLGQVVLLDGIPEGLSEDTRSGDDNVAFRWYGGSKEG